jgi:hypothetical protein
MSIEIKEGMTLVCDTLEWRDECWEFDHPSMMLSPVIRCFESGIGHESIVEDALIDAVVNGRLESEDFDEQWAWRGYKLPLLRRRFHEALSGKEFPKARYKAKRSTVVITKDKNGELIWEEKR